MRSEVRGAEDAYPPAYPGVTAGTTCPAHVPLFSQSGGAAVEAVEELKTTILKIFKALLEGGALHGLLGDVRRWLRRAAAADHGAGAAWWQGVWQPHADQAVRRLSLPGGVYRFQLELVETRSMDPRRSARMFVEYDYVR